MIMTAEWGEITAEDIIKPLKGKLISGTAGSVLTGVSTDSRKIEAGNLFLALRGERYDGHDFVEQTIEQGASGVVIEKGRKKDISANNGAAIIEVQDTLRALGDLAGWWRHEHNVLVVAITGSSGKTTVKEMTANILGLGARTIKNEGNLNNLIGLPQSLLRLGRKERRAVLEMGMNRPGEIRRLTEIADPDIGLITNVARVHLEGLGDIKGVARAKAELLERISDKGQVILYGDDDLLMKEALRFKRGIMMTYGLGPDNEIRADKIKSLGWEGTLFDLQCHGESVTIKLKVPGRQNIFNALAAAAIALCVEESFEHIVAGLGRFEGIRGRFMPFSLPNDVILVDDTYNSNPYSLRAALDSIKEITGCNRRLIVGLGEMMELGEETARSHFEAGDMVAESGASYLFAMGDHAGEMVKGALEKGLPPARAVEVKSHQDMAQKIGEVVKKGDLILLKGSRKMGLEKVFQSLKERRLGNAV
jgi:UDP-N-acetylmuramoyl-tripeptide--D-alanyl-D-alanine ligase